MDQRHVLRLWADPQRRYRRLLPPRSHSGRRPGPSIRHPLREGVRGGASARRTPISSTALRTGNLASRDRFPLFRGFLCETRTPGKAAAGTAPRRPRFRHVMECHDSSRWPLASLCCAGFRNRQTILLNMFFCTPAFLPEAASPARAGANRRPPKKQFCSYNVPVRASSAFFAPSPFGFRLGIPLRKGKGRAAAPFFALSGFRRGIRQVGFSGATGAYSGPHPVSTSRCRHRRTCRSPSLRLPPQPHRSSPRGTAMSRG